MKIKFLLLCLFVSQFTIAQDLQKERLWRIDGDKKSIYLEKGIFHTGNKKVSAQLLNVRHSFSSAQGYERVVFDFSSSDIPKIYGYLSPGEKKLYLDFFDTGMKDNVKFPGNSRHIKNLDFYPLSAESLSLELKFKDKVTADIFYLKNPARLVIDLKR